MDIGLLCNFAKIRKNTAIMIRLQLLQTKPQTNQNTLFVVQHQEQLPHEILSPEELNYLKDTLTDSNGFVELNRYAYSWYFVAARFDQTHNLVLEKARKLGDSLQKEWNNRKFTQINLVDLSLSADYCLALAEGAALGNYQFLNYKTDKSLANTLTQLSLYAPGLSYEQVTHAQIKLEAVFNCRNLVNEPVINLSATQLAEHFEVMFEGTGVKVDIFNKKKIEALKMGGLLAVNSGSSEPPTFSILEWKPANAKNQKPVVLVGKGVTFDTGGMNIKTGSFMDHMKTDMSGAATVASVVYAIAKSQLPVYVMAFIPATDNRINSNAIVSGDVLVMHSGKTVEVLNTDAEGRLILADALSYAQAYDPLLAITVATLTGSAARAIGKYGIVAMQNNAIGPMQHLKESGDAVHERIAEFPFWDDYAELIKSDVADLKNIGPMEGGAITAGKFLEAFTNYPFIHLDIAGCAYSEKRDSYRNQGATGMPVRLLIHFLAITEW